MAWHINSTAESNSIRHDLNYFMGYSHSPSLWEFSNLYNILYYAIAILFLLYVLLFIVFRAVNKACVCATVFKCIYGSNKDWLVLKFQTFELKIRQLWKQTLAQTLYSLNSSSSTAKLWFFDHLNSPKLLLFHFHAAFLYNKFWLLLLTLICSWFPWVCTHNIEISHMKTVIIFFKGNLYLSHISGIANLFCRLIIFSACTPFCINYPTLIKMNTYRASWGRESVHPRSRRIFIIS